MPLRQTLCDLLAQLQQANLFEAGKKLNTALAHHPQEISQIFHSVDAQWQAHWPEDLPRDLSDLCRDRLQAIYPTPQVSGNEVIQTVLRWHYGLFEQLSGFCANNGGTGNPSGENGKPVLCGFNFVKDQLFPLASEVELNQLVQAWGNPTPGHVQKRPQSPEDVLACLLHAAEHPDEENKFYIDDPDLLRHTVLAGAGPNGADLAGSESLGGAAGNSAYVLSHMGFETDVYGPYHSDDLPWGQLDQSHASHLDLSTNPPSPIPVQQAQSGLPSKTTMGIQFIPSWQSAQFNVNVDQPSRALFIGSGASTSNTKTWHQVSFVYNNQSINWPFSSGSHNWQNPHIWPYPPLFVRHFANQGNTLEFHLADTSAISTLAKNRPYSVAFLKELGYYKEPAALMNARADQLLELQEAGVPIHVELSPGSNLGLLKDCLSDRPWSVSCNQDDLLELTAHAKPLTRHSYGTTAVDPFLFSKQSVREGPFERFLRAKHLLRSVDARWLYVHGNELDLAVWQSDSTVSSSTMGENLSNAMLLAKAAVIATMIERDVPYRLYSLIMDYLQGATLSLKGFWALFEFVSEFGAWASTRYSMSAKKGEAQDARDKLLRQGWCEIQDIGIAVAPVLWPDVARYLNATGAGDCSSAVVAAYVW